MIKLTTLSSKHTLYNIYFSKGCPTWFPHLLPQKEYSGTVMILHKTKLKIKFVSYKIYNYIQNIIQQKCHIQTEKNMYNLQPYH